MRNVVYALLPICCYSVWLFGFSALALIVTTTGACVLIEHLSCRMAGRETSVGDFSVVITGILLGLTLPPGLPLWMAVVGAFIAVAPGKMIFGGLGFNVFNPALVGRAFLQAAFPVAITTYTPALAMHRFAEFIPTTLAIPFLKAAPLKDWIAQRSRGWLYRRDAADAAEIRTRRDRSLDAVPRRTRADRAAKLPRF